MKNKNPSLLFEAEKIKGKKPCPVFFSCVIALLLFILFCGSSLWIPVSRMSNIRLKTFLMPVCDMLSLPGEFTRLDRPIPFLRDYFIKVAGVENLPSWDTRFFNQRKTVSYGTVKKTERDEDEKNLKITKDTKTSSSIVYSKDSPLKIYIFGDSQITGLGAGFDRLTKNIVQIDAKHLGIISSGFIRDEYYNWLSKIKDETSKNDYNVAIFMLGMNDNIDFADSKGNPILRRTAKWESYYSKRCRELLKEVTKDFSKVYWLGMPMPRSKTYNKNLIYIDEIHEKLSKEYDQSILERVSIRDIFPGKQMEYCDNKVFDGGSVLRVMGKDGIHLTIPGGQWVMSAVLNRIEEDFVFENPLAPVVLPK